MDDATRAAALERLQPLVGEWTAELRFSFTPEPTAGWLSFAWELDGSSCSSAPAPSTRTPRAASA